MIRYATQIRDAVHGDIPLTSEELQVLDTVEMQRLRDVRQLGTAYQVYPGAQHSRFEHSIGTTHLVGRMAAEVNAVRDREGSAHLGGFDEQEVRILRMAALVHDVTHLPFGHNIEDQTGLLPRHDRPERFEWVFSSETELGQVLQRLGLRDEVFSVLAPSAVPAEKRPPDSWHEMVSGTIDADLLDYLARDAHYTGLDLSYDSRIFSMFRIERRTNRLYVDLAKRGYLRESLLSELLRCLEARYYFTERVYFHHAKVAMGALVAKAVEEALIAGALRFEDLRQATDAGLIDRLEEAAREKPVLRPRLQPFVQAYRARRVPKRVAVYPAYANASVQAGMIERFFGSGSADERRKVEARLGEAVRFVAGHEVPVLLYCPAGHMQLKQARMLVRWPGRDELSPLRDFADEVPRLADLEAAYPRLWKFYVLALTDDEKVLEALRELCASEFPDAHNVLAPARDRASC